MDGQGGRSWDVIVAGAGNAAFCAAFAAREGGARVLLVEKAPRAWLGGNSYFTAGAIRTTYASLDDLRPLLEERLTDEEAAGIALPPYSPAQFLADMVRLTEGECDRELAGILARDAADAVRWLHGKGLRFRLLFDRQSFAVGGKRRFFGNLTLGTVGGGQGLIAQELAAAERLGIAIRCESPVVGLLRAEGGAVRGVVVRRPDGQTEEIAAGAVVLAAGGFEANAAMRAAHLGPDWARAKVRGTPTTPGRCCGWRSRPGRSPTASGPAPTRSSGTPTRPTPGTAG